MEKDEEMGEVGIFELDLDAEGETEDETEGETEDECSEASEDERAVSQRARCFKLNGQTWEFDNPVSLVLAAARQLGMAIGRDARFLWIADEVGPPPQPNLHPFHLPRVTHRSPTLPAARRAHTATTLPDPPRQHLPQAVRAPPLHSTAPSLPTAHHSLPRITARPHLPHAHAARRRWWSNTRWSALQLSTLLH